MTLNIGCFADSYLERSRDLAQMSLELDWGKQGLQY